MSLAEFKRRIKVGQHVTVVNYMYPTLSGERTVHQVQSRTLKTMAEGARDPWSVPWPAKGEWRIENDTLHWVDPENPDKINVSYTFRFDAAEQDEPATTADRDSESEQESILTSYRVTWAQKGKDQSRTEICIVDSGDMARPDDPEQLNELLRRMLANRHLPIGQGSSSNIVLHDVIPVCNCEPHPGENCAWAEHGGYRFRLAPSTIAGFEAIHDRHGNKILGAVNNTLSVAFLTLVRQKYSHQ
ncbi:hypothetical protein [Streptomyces sp. NPDC056921]|uniref:hypothetical protein n=1 Tax=Streptomyces sp. NPDC056921 TaxID=3345966 RepID=UPI00363B9621